ncbi:MAG: hypothetical protein ACP5U0_08780 [Caldisphaera sp.]
MRKMIKITKDLILKILSINLGFVIEQNEVVGQVIRMPPRQALVYAITTGHGYIDENEPDNIYRLTRDNFRVFNQALEFNLQEGVFSLSDLRLASTLNREASKKPYLIEEDKFILPVEYEKYQDFQKFLKDTITKLKSRGFNPNNFIIAPIRKNNSTVSELEPFFEYVVSVYFNRQKYITDTQIPFFYSIGTPDIAAYRIPHLFDILIKYGFIDEGSSIVELMTTSIFGFYRPKDYSNIERESIVFEVKTNQSSAPQIKKYTQTMIFSKAYEVIPVTKKPEAYAGLITITPRGELIKQESTKPIPFSIIKQNEYFSWIEIYLKIYILANLETNEFEDLMSKNGFVISQKQLITFIKKIEFEKLVREIKEYIDKR